MAKPLLIANLKSAQLESAAKYWYLSQSGDPLGQSYTINVLTWSIKAPKSMGYLHGWLDASRAVMSK